VPGFGCRTVAGTALPGAERPLRRVFSSSPCKVLTILLQGGTVEMQARAMTVQGGRHGSKVRRQGPRLAQQRVPHRVG
jgi:hypothetical protein